MSENLGDQPIKQSIDILSHNQRLLHVSVGSLFSLAKKTTVRLLGSADNDLTARTPTYGSLRSKRSNPLDRSRTTQHAAEPTNLETKNGPVSAATPPSLATHQGEPPDVTPTRNPTT